MKKILFFMYLLISILSCNQSFADDDSMFISASDAINDPASCDVGFRNSRMRGNSIFQVSLGGAGYAAMGCVDGKFLIKCEGAINETVLPECADAKNGVYVFQDGKEGLEKFNNIVDNLPENEEPAPQSEPQPEPAPQSEPQPESAPQSEPQPEPAPQSEPQPEPAPQPEPSATASSEPAQTTPPDAGKILDTKTESGKKTDLSSQSVTGSTKQPTIGGTAAMQSEKGKTTSGNVEKSSFAGASNLGDDYGMGNCGSGNIFQQLACRAGIIGSGLKTVGYMIAGFGLIVFSFAAIFGKVKWPLFATIMFSCFLLSATVFVVNMMTKNGDASWIGGIKSGGFDYSSTTTPQGNVDKVAVTKETM